MKRGNCSWIEWISYLHAYPSQLTHAVPVMWFIVTVLLLSRSMFFVCEGPSQKAMRHENPISKKLFILISPKIGSHLERKTNQIFANNQIKNDTYQRTGQQNQTKTSANQTDSPQMTQQDHIYTIGLVHMKHRGGEQTPNYRVQHSSQQQTT